MSFSLARSLAPSLARCLASPARIFAQASLLLTLGALFGVTMSEAGEGRRDWSEDVIEQFPPLSREGFDEIVTQLPPLKPIKKRAAPGVVKAAQPASQMQEPIASKEREAVSTASELAKLQPAPETRDAAKQVVATVAQSSAQAQASAAAALGPENGAAQAPPAPVAETPSPLAEPRPFAEPRPLAEQGGSAALASSAFMNPAFMNEVDAAQVPPTAEASSPNVPIADAAPEAAAPGPATGAPAGAHKPEPASAEAAARAAAIIEAGVKGPATVHIAGRAGYSAPEGRIFLPKEKARELVEAAGHQWDEATVGVVLGASSGFEWLAFIDLLDDGYIRDEDAAILDEAKLLEVYKASVAANNEVRARGGAKPLAISGWVDPPRYDEKHRLVSCIGATIEPASDSHNGVVNCTSYALGRDGAFKIIVATTRDGYETLKGEASRIAENIVYDPGRGYADVHLATDKIAPYGLAALATGSRGSIQPARKGPEAVDVPPESGAAGALFEYAALALAGLTGAGLLAHKFMKKTTGPARNEDPSREAANTSQKKAPAWAGAAAKLEAKLAGLRRMSAVAGPSAEPQGAISEELSPSSRSANSSTSVSDADELHGVVLSKLAALMRKNAPEPTPAVNIDRWTRQQQMKSRAAPQGAAPVGGRNDALAPSRGDSDVGLIEPGDADAASKAMNAQRALFAASA